MPKGWVEGSQGRSKKPKSWSREIVEQPIQDDPVDRIGYSLLFPNIGAFLIIVFLPLKPQQEILALGAYVLGSMIFILSRIRVYYIANGRNSKQFYKNMVRRRSSVRHRIYNKLGYFFMISLFAFIVIYYLNLSNVQLVPALSSVNLFEFSVYALVLWILVYSSQILLCYSTPAVLSKDYNFFEAQEKLDNIRGSLSLNKKAKLLIGGLKSYNRYIERKTGFGIKDITKICSRILTDSRLSVNDSLEKLRNSFHEDSDVLNEAGQLSNDGLTLLKTISAMFDNMWSEDILKKGYSREKITLYMRPLLPIAGPVLTIILPLVLSQMGIEVTNITNIFLGE